MQLEKVVESASISNASVFLCVPIRPPKITMYCYNEIVKGIKQTAKSKNCGIIDLSVCQELIKTFDNAKIHPKEGEGYRILAERIIKSLKTAGAANNLALNGNSNVKNERMKKILSNVNRAFSDTFGWYALKGSMNTFSDKGVRVHSVCTSGPTTWYKKAGINLTWWSPKTSKTSDYQTTLNNFRNLGFELVWHGTKQDALKLKSSQFSPGDIVAIFATNARGNNTSHGAMWTGYDWRGDFIQNGIWVYPRGQGRQGDYSVCIFRHPDLQ